MPDLTLKEALEQYEPECREVLDEHMYECTFGFPMPHGSEAEAGYITHLIGACVQWLWNRQGSAFWTPEDSPLQWMLEEVRAHMEAGS